MENRKVEQVESLALLCTLVALLLLSYLQLSLAPKSSLKAYVMLTFDTEDFITPEANDVLESLVKILNTCGLKGEFYFVAEKMRVLAEGRPEILALLEEGGHVVGYHQNGHSVHPTIAEYSNVSNWEEAVRAAYLHETRRVNVYTGELSSESGGLTYMAELLGSPPVSFRPPGYVWSPAVVYVLRSLGVKVFSLTHAFRAITGEDLNWYMGTLQVPAADLYMDSYLVRGDLQELKEAFLKLASGGRRLVVLALHPCMLATSKFWDFNYYGGRNSGSPENVRLPPLRGKEATRRALETFEEFIEFLKGLEDVQIITSEDLLKLVGEDYDEVITREELVEVASTIVSSRSLPSYLRTSSGLYLSLAEAYIALVKAALSYLERGELPSTTQLSWEDRLVLGPVEHFDNGGRTLNVSASLLGGAFSEALRATEEAGRVPASVAVGGYRLSAADLLYLSAYVVWSAERGGMPRFISFTGREVLPDSAHVLRISYSWPCLPSEGDFGVELLRARLQLWTIKPEPLRGQVRSLSGTSRAPTGSP